MKNIQQQINIDIDTLSTVLCDCGNHYFEQVVMLKVIPALYSQTGKQAILTVPCMKCTKCGVSRPQDVILKSVMNGGLVK
jgi:hypothetical protein